MADQAISLDAGHKPHDKVDSDSTVTSLLQEDSHNLNAKEQRSDIDYWQQKQTASTQSVLSLSPLSLDGTLQEKHLTRGLQVDATAGAESKKLTVTSEQDGYTVSKTADNGEIQSTFHDNNGNKTQTVYRPDGTSTQTLFDRTGQVSENIERDSEGHYTKQSLYANGSLEIEEGQGNSYVQTSYDSNGRYVGSELQWHDADGTKHRKNTDDRGNWHQIDSSENFYKDTIGKANGFFDSQIMAGDLAGMHQTHVVKPDGSTSDEFTDQIERIRKNRETDTQGNYTEIEWHGEKRIGSTRHTLNEDGSVSDTSFDETGKTIGNRETKSDGSFNEQRLDKDGTLTIKAQDSQGNFKQLNHSTDGDIISTIEHHKESNQRASELELNRNGSVRNRWIYADGSYNEQSLNGLNKKLTIHEQSANGNYTATLYDSNMSKISKTIHEHEQSGEQTDTVYDAAGNIVKHRDTQASGSYIQQEVNPSGIVTAEYDADRGVKTETSYNLKGKIKSESIVKENHFYEKTVFDGKGNFKQNYKNTEGEKRETTGDAKGNRLDRIFQKDKRGETVLQGQRIHNVDGKGGWSTIELNSAGQRLRQIDAQKDGSKIEQTWHKNGHLMTHHAQDAQGNFKHLSFSENGTKTSETIQTKNADGSTTLTRFDGKGRVISNRESKQDGSYSEQYLKPDGSINLYSQTKSKLGFEINEQEFDPFGEKITN